MKKIFNLNDKYKTKALHDNHISLTKDYDIFKQLVFEVVTPKSVPELIIFQYDDAHECWTHLAHKKLKLVMDGFNDEQNRVEIDDFFDCKGKKGRIDYFLKQMKYFHARLFGI